MSGGVDVYGNLLDSTQAYSGSLGWVSYPSLPIAKTWHCQVTVGRAVYVIAGIDGNLKSSNSVFSLSDKQKHWKQEKSLPVSTHDLACAVMGTKIYVMGGYGMEGQLSSVYILDTSIPGSSWQTGPQLPESRVGALAFVHDNKVYLLGGDSSDSVLTLGPDAKSWTEVGRVWASRQTFPAPLISRDSMHCK